MLRVGFFVTLFILAISGVPAARAAALSVIPITVTVVGPATIGTITLRNREVQPLNAQVRVFRWTQFDGHDKLVPTDDVVASPPIVTISAGADYVVRLQRVASSQIIGEEAYRTVIDELPNPNRQRNGTVAIVLRYLVPTFFLSPDASQPRLIWSLARHRNARILTATNSGDKRIQITDLKLKTRTHRTLLIARGLAGYVLGHSSRTWIVPARSGPLSGGIVLASSDHGHIHAALSR